MGERCSTAAVLTVVLFLSIQLPISNQSLEENQLFSTGQDEITSTEVRIHNLGGSWDDNQVLEWSPNHLEFNRTIQFSILIEGVNSTDKIESMTLNMTWIYNVSTGDPLLSENLSISSLKPHENGLFMYFNYTYPLDIFHDEYEISLDTLDSDGLLHTFNHKGINVIAYDMHLNPVGVGFDSKILFANNQITSLELFIQNTGSVYTDIEFQIIFLTQLPSNWNQPNLFILDANLSGGENSTALFEFQAPSDAYPSKDPMPSIEFQLIAEFEDFTGQMVEFYNVNYSLESELVPFDSLANISAYRTNFSTDLIKNNFIELDSNVDVLEYSLISFENRSIEFFFEFENFGFSQTTFELEVVSQNSIDFEVYSSTDDQRSLEGQQSTITNLQPLDSVYFRCQINFISENQITKDPIAIIIRNANSGTTFDLEIPIFMLEFDDLLYSTLDLDSFELVSNLSSPQNDSFTLFLSIPWNNVFDVSYFENNWRFFVTISGPDSLAVPQISFELQQNNSSITNPYEFTIDENQFFSILFDIGKDTDIGNYSIDINIGQITDDTINALNFETQLELTILENSSLFEPGQNDSDDDDLIDDSNNTSNNNSTDIGQDNLTNSSSNDLVNNTDEQINNSTNNTQQNNTDLTQNQDGDSDSNDSTKSQDEDTKSWIYIILALIVISLTSIFFIRKKISRENPNLEDKTIVEINTPVISNIQPEINSDEGLTVLHQWTDNNGYTWKQMSDRSMLWWNGTEWVPVNYN